MKILYLHQYFVSPEHSGGTRSYEFARRLVAHGHEVTLVTTSSYLSEDWAPQSGWNIREIEGVRVAVMRSSYSNKMSHLGRVREFLRFAVGATKYAWGCEADVIFATSTPLTISLPAVAASWRLKAPFVFEVRDLWPEVPIALGALGNPLLRFVARRLEAWSYDRADHVVALSPDMSDGIVDTGVDPAKISVIPNASDLDLFAVAPHVRTELRHRYEWLGDRPLALYAGTLGVVNEVEYFVHMARSTLDLDPEIRYVIIGDGNRRAAVEKLAAEQGVLGVNLFILDPVPKIEIAAFVAASDISFSLVAPVEALWRNSANKVFDAMAAGTAVGINYRGWQSHLLESEGAGYVFPGGAPAAAGRQLVDVLRDSPGLEATGRAARILAEKSFGRDDLASKLETILCRVASRFRTGSPI